MSERYYQLLPAWYRQRDTDRSLKALCAVLDEVHATLEADIQSLWDDWFIETCRDDLVPYIGALVGVEGLRAVDAIGFSLRSYVANALVNRQRKGTPAAIEQGVWDTSGYRAVAVVWQGRIARTESVNHRLGASFASVRDPLSWERVGGPFDTSRRTADVRRLPHGRYNLPNIGVHTFRTRTWRIAEVEARPLVGGFYDIHPVASPEPVWHPPASEPEAGTLTTEVNTPHLLSRRALYAQEIGSAPAEDLGSAVAVTVYARSGDVWSSSAPTIRVCNLEGATTIPVGAGEIGLDPELGRVALVPTDAEVDIRVTYVLGSTGPLGAGPWDRDVTRAVRPAPAFQVGVGRRVTPVGSEAIFETLEEAVEAWQDSGANTGVILLLDSGRYTAPPTTISIPAGGQLALLAASWPTEPDPILGGQRRAVGAATASGVRPHIDGTVRVQGGTLVLDGLSIAGDLEISDLVRVDLGNCTLWPPGTVRVGAASESLELVVSASILGGIEASGALADVMIAGSAVSGDIVLPETSVNLEATTVRGDLACRTLSATDVILDGDVQVSDHQAGCVRFSYVKPNGRTPRRYRCQPDRALEGAVEPELVRARVRPAYVSLDPADAGFFRLRADGPYELTTTSEALGEPGVHASLQHTLRLQNARAALRDAVRLGMEAEILLEE